MVVVMRGTDPEVRLTVSMSADAWREVFEALSVREPTPECVEAFRAVRHVLLAHEVIAGVL